MLAVIGDVHGQYDALRKLDARLPPAAERVFVGDLFDRGPKSREVFEVLRDTPHRRVRGNHEQQLLDALQGREGDMGLDGWLDHNGGRATVESFGNRFPHELVDFLENTPLYLETDGLLIVHAGIRPGVPLERQEPFDLMWIREEFYEAKDHGYPGTVVFGHTSFSGVVMGARWVGCDTGAGWGRWLSAALFEEGVYKGSLSEPV